MATFTTHQGRSSTTVAYGTLGKTMGRGVIGLPGT